MAEPRPASHDDDPHAPLADRLLLALGIWPHHARQAGDNEVVEAAVVLRTRAHREPMIAEDWGTERALREELEAIVRDLAGHNTVETLPNRTFWCRLCGVGPLPLPVSEPDQHEESCPWRRANELVDPQEESE